MADVVDRATRSRMMAGIRGKDTKPEILIRKALFAQGFRYRLHAAELPGKPDLVFPKYNAGIFIHGCFWHGHTCHYFKVPGTHKKFWLTKIQGNRDRDSRQIARLRNLGWRVLIIWECVTRKNPDMPFGTLIDHVRHWLIRCDASAQLDTTGIQPLPCSPIE